MSSRDIREMAYKLVLNEMDRIISENKLDNYRDNKIFKRTLHIIKDNIDSKRRQINDKNNPYKNKRTAEYNTLECHVIGCNYSCKNLSAWTCDVRIKKDGMVLYTVPFLNGVFTKDTAPYIGDTVFIRSRKTIKNPDFYIGKCKIFKKS